MALTKTHYEFKPYNVARWVIWGLFTLLLVVSPLVFTSNLSITNDHNLFNKTGLFHCVFN